MIYLKHQKQGNIYYVLDDKTMYIGAMHQGVPSIANTECLYKAENISELLHTLHESKDERWYVVQDYIDSNEETRHEKYPLHCELHKLVGYVPEVCDIRKRDKTYSAEWEVDFLSELWIKDTEFCILKVVDFTEIRWKEVQKFVDNINE